MNKVHIILINILNSLKYDILLINNTHNEYEKTNKLYNK